MRFRRALGNRNLASRILAGLSLLLALAAVALAGGFAVFTYDVLQPARPPPKADGIVALTGGAERVETALRLLASGQADLMLVSGVAHGAALSDLTRRVDLEPAVFGDRITLGRTAVTTFGNAEETADWVQAHAIHSLIVVTASYHMPRAMLELRRALPAVTLFCVPVQPPGVTRTSELRLLTLEYAKLLAAWIGLSRVISQPFSTVLHRPVDNSVSG